MKLVRAIGVSNYRTDDLKALDQTTYPNLISLTLTLTLTLTLKALDQTVLPAVNQCR